MSKQDLNKKKMGIVKVEREIGYYWCYGVAWHDVKHWAIYWWDGVLFWNGDEDLGEESIQKIDENQIEKIDRAINFIETNTMSESKSKSKNIMTEIKDLQGKIITTLISRIASDLDNKVKECLIAWGVDLDNHEEIGKRCTLEMYEINLNYLKIDGYLVMSWGCFEGFEIGHANFSTKGYKCSGILTPKDYKL